MDHDELDPLSPPPSHTQYPDDVTGYPQHQTVPNIESGDGVGDPYDPNDLHQSEDPKNFHHADGLDLPANFAKDPSQFQHGDEDVEEDYYGQSREQEIGNDYNDDEDDQYYNQQQQQQQYQQQHSNQFADETEEAMYYQQQQQQQQQQQHQFQGDYDDSDAGSSSLGNSLNTSDAHSNPFAQSDSSYLGSSAGLNSNPQDFGAGDNGGVDRPIVGGEGYPQGFDPNAERSPMSDVRHDEHLQHRGDEVYDDNSDEGEDEGMAREDIEERRLCESGSSLPEQDGSYGVSPPEADRFGEQQTSHDDMAEGQMIQGHQEESLPQGGGFDDSDGMVEMAGMKQGGADEGEAEGESDSERHDGNFGYNKMEEEETAEDVSDDEERLNASGNVGGDTAGQDAAGFDNHAFDDNDDEDAEVIQRKTVDEAEEEAHHPEDELDSFGTQQQDQQFVPEEQQMNMSEPQGHFETQENVPISAGGGFSEGDDFGKDDRQYEEERDDEGGDDGEGDRNINLLPERSDNYMNIDCTGSNFGRGFEGEGEEDKYESSGGSDVLRREEEDRMNEEDRQMAYGDDEEDRERMEVEQECVKEDTTTTVESAMGDRYDSNIDDDKENIDIGGGVGGMERHEDYGNDEEEEVRRESGFEKEEYEEEVEREAEQAFSPPQQQTYDDIHDQPSDVLSSSIEAEHFQQDETVAVTDEVNDGESKNMYDGEGEKEEEEEEENERYQQEDEQQHIEREASDDEENQVCDSTGQSAGESHITPSSMGDDFQAVTSVKEGEVLGDESAAKPPRSFVDMIEDMASPETVPQPLPSPPKPESMSHEFDPLAGGDNSDDEVDRDEEDFIMDKQQQLQQQQMEYQQHDDLQDSQPLGDGNDVGLYDTNHHVTNGDAREESSEDLCLRAGEIEGETKFGVDGSAITTSADQTMAGAFDESDASPQTASYEEKQADFQQQQQQTPSQQFDEGEGEEDDIDDVDDDIINAGQATDNTTTTTEATEDRSAGEFDSTSLGQAGFEQGFETGGGVDTDNALMSMSMEGSFYDDGGDLMGGQDGVAVNNEGSNLLIQSAITEVSEPTSSFSPHTDSVLRSEQQAFEEKLLSQQQDEGAEESEGDFSQSFNNQQFAPEESHVTPEQSVATESAIPSGFEDQPIADPVTTAPSAFSNDLDDLMGQGQQQQQQFNDEGEDYNQKQNNAIFDNNEDVDVSSQPFTQNGGAADVDSLMDAGVYDTPATGDHVTSSSVDDPFGLQRNDLDVGMGGEVGSEFNSSSVDNNADLIGNGFQDGGVNGMVHHEEESASLVSREDVTNSSAAFEGHDLDQGTVTLTDDPLDKTGGAATDDVSISSAAEVSEISSSQPAASSSVDAEAAATTVAATAVKAEKDDKKKTSDDKDKDKKKTGVTKDTKATSKTPTTKRPTSATTKTTSSATKKTTTTTSTTAKKTTTTTTPATKSTTTASKTPSSARPTSARPTSATSAAKKTETSKTTTSTTARKTTTTTSTADKKTSASSPTKTTSTTPGSAKPLPRYAQPVTPRKPRDSSLSAPRSGDATAAKKTPTTRPTTAPTTPRTRPTSAGTKPSTTPSSRLTSTTASTTSSPRPKTSPTKLTNGSSTPADKRSTSPTKRYTTPRPASTTSTPTSARSTADKKDVKASPRIPLSARSPTKPSTPRTPSNSATPRTGAAATNGKSATPKKADYSNVTSRIGSKDKITHKPGGGNVKIESRKVKVEAKSKIGSLDNASHKPQGGDKKIETKKLDWKVESKIGSLDNACHVAGGGDKKIEVVKTEWKATSRIGSLDNASHKPGGGDKKIETQKTDWSATSRIGSLEKANHKPGGGDKKIETVKTDWSAQSKIGSLNNVNHKPGGGDKQIETHQLDFKEKAAPKIGSLTPKRLNSSGSEQSEPVLFVVENGADGGSPV